MEEIKVLRVPISFLQNEVKIEEDKLACKLTTPEALVLAYLYSKSRSNFMQTTATCSEIAKSLNISPKTVSRAVKTLLQAKLIFRHINNDFYMSRSKISKNFGV